MRLLIEVKEQPGLVNAKAGLYLSVPGVHDITLPESARGWLVGQVERGHARVLTREEIDRDLPHLPLSDYDNPEGDAEQERRNVDESVSVPCPPTADVDSQEWWVLYVSDPERYAAATGERLPVGSILRVEPLKPRVKDVTLARQGISLYVLPGRPSAEGARWHPLYQQFVATGRGPMWESPDGALHTEPEARWWHRFPRFRR